METLFLVISPGIALWVGGMGYGVWRYARDRMTSLRAAQARLLGLAWIFLAGSAYLTLLVLDGRANRWAMLGVVFMVGFGLFQLYLARHIEFPTSDDG